LLLGWQNKLQNKGKINAFVKLLIKEIFHSFFEKEKQRIRPPEVNLLFELTKRTTSIYENKKSGILTHNEMDSALVDLSVPVSNFFRKLFLNFVE